MGSSPQDCDRAPPARSINDHPCSSVRELNPYLRMLRYCLTYNPFHITAKPDRNPSHTNLGSAIVNTEITLVADLTGCECGGHDVTRHDTSVITKDHHVYEQPPTVALIHLSISKYPTAITCWSVFMAHELNLSTVSVCCNSPDTTPFRSTGLSVGSDVHRQPQGNKHSCPGSRRAFMFQCLQVTREAECDSFKRVQSAPVW